MYVSLHKLLFFAVKCLKINFINKSLNIINKKFFFILLKKLKLNNFVSNITHAYIGLSGRNNKIIKKGIAGNAITKWIFLHSFKA